MSEGVVSALSAWIAGTVVKLPYLEKHEENDFNEHLLSRAFCFPNRQGMVLCLSHGGGSKHAVGLIDPRRVISLVPRP